MTALDTTLSLVAPVSGVVVSLDRVPDPVFAQRLVGDGISIDPLGDTIVAPCDARVLQVHRAHHAITLAAHGVEIILHVGLDTVGLNGDGFHPLVASGADVRAGDPLLRFDADLVARRARSLLTEMVVSTSDRILGQRVDARGIVEAGRDVVVTLQLAAARSEPVARATGGRRTAAVTVESRVGLHARPAALIAAAARRFQASVQLRKGDGKADARSVVAIMALEAAQGDEVIVDAQGDDADAACDALVALIATNLDADAPAAATVASRAPEQRSTDVDDSQLHGTTASPGIAIGPAFQLKRSTTTIADDSDDPAEERRALVAAIERARDELNAARSHVASEVDELHAGIFGAHAELLDDPELVDDATTRIDAGHSAAFAWHAAFTAQAGRLAGLRNATLAARAADLRDVGRRVEQFLAGDPGAATESIPSGAVVIADDLQPSDVLALRTANARGLCTTTGSATSHVAILARGLGIPAIVGIDGRALDIPSGGVVILDADAGRLNPSPSASDQRTAEERRRELDTRRARDLAHATTPALTVDRHRIEVAANVGDDGDAARLRDSGADGVGLLRSEFLFLDRSAAPTEDEQLQRYESVTRALGHERLLVIRTLDIGGDKPTSYLPLDAEANPFLGERGIRVSLRHPELFRTQVRAVLRASTGGRVAMMFPMIATLAEWRAARAIVDDERAKLDVAPIPLGIMVETPAAALIADRFAREVDFLSIGTNDLTQYTLAMDRTNPRLSAQVDALHPSVLRLIEYTAKAGKAHHKWVGVCGALAGDIDAVPLLLGLGITELSVDLPLLPAVKARVRGVSLDECRATAREALEAENGGEVRAIVARRHPRESASLSEAS